MTTTKRDAVRPRQVWQGESEWRQVISVGSGRVNYVVRRAPVGRFSMQVESATESSFRAGFKLVREEARGSP